MYTMVSIFERKFIFKSNFHRYNILIKDFKYKYRKSVIKRWVF